MKVENDDNRMVVWTYQDAFTLRVPASTDGAVERITKNGDTVYERRFSKVAGKITSVELRDGDYGKIVNINMISDDGAGTVCLMLDSKFAFDFLVRFENINWHEEVTLNIWSNYDPAFLATMQNGELVKRVYDKADLPEWEEKTVSGKKVWDKTKSLDFFEQKIKQVMAEVFANGNTAKDPLEPKKEVVEADDLPW